VSTEGSSPVPCFNWDRTGHRPYSEIIIYVPGVLSLGLKRPEREADHSLHLGPRSRMCGAVTLIPQYASMAWCSVKKKAQEQLYLYLQVFDVFVNIV